MNIVDQLLKADVKKAEEFNLKVSNSQMKKIYSEILMDK